MCPLLWKQTLYAKPKRLAVISALLTDTPTLFSRYYASLALKTSSLGHCLLNSEVNIKICNNFGVISTFSNQFSTARAATLLKTTDKTNNMPPKAKKAATSSKPAKKTEKHGKTEKAKAPKKNEEPKVASRQSKRNVDKVAISYKEVAENVDEKASERRQPAKAAKKAKKSKYVDSGSDVSDESSEEADSEDEKRKKKKAAAARAKPAKEKKAPAPKRVKKAAVEAKKPAAVDESDEADDDDEKEPEAKKAKVESGSEEEEEKKDEKKEVKKEKKEEAKEKKEEKKEGKEDKKDVKEVPVVKKAPVKAEKEAPKKAAKDEDTKEPTNKTTTDFEAIDFKSDKTTKDGKPSNYKISSWNICGLKAWMKKGAMDFIKHESPDIFCMMETRCSEAKLPPGTKVDGYHAYWVSGEKEGYAGVGLYSKVMPIEVKYGLGKEEHDNEGRVITAEYEKFFVVATYVPNAGRGLVTLPKRLKWDPDMRSYLKDLDDKKPVILCGDLNVAHQAIDLANPKTNLRTAGFTQEERDGMSELLKEGFVDSYRHLYPDKADAYTYWTFMSNARSRNVGWRLDYFILSEKLLPNLCDNLIRSEVYGSDHCPITLFLNV